MFEVNLMDLFQPPYKYHKALQTGFYVMTYRLICNFCYKMYGGKMEFFWIFLEIPPRKLPVADLTLRLDFHHR